MTEKEGHNEQTAENISRRKAATFKITAVLIPFLLLFLVEAGLRLAGYGSSFPVFIEAEGRPGYMVMNPSVSEKYFFSKQNATAGYREYFKKDKDDDVFRIFVLGLLPV